MRTIRERLILASLFLSTALLAAGSAYAVPLYFPHVVTSTPWQTEIAIINTGNQAVTGTLRGFGNQGQIIGTQAVTLPAHGRRQITVANEFTDHTSVRYIIVDTASTSVQGYTKFYQEGVYRAAIPAVREVNTSDIYIPHIASNDKWWTAISLLNTTSTRKELTITFNNGQSIPYPLNANEYKAINILELFNNQPQPDIQSAVITNASGVIGLELFGNIGGSDHLDGILLTDKTASTIHYPHVASDHIWWTGIAAYNPSTLASTITITPYSEQGAPLTPSILSIAGKEKYVGEVSNLSLPADTAWFRIDATRPLSGFELFGTIDGNQLAAYAGGGKTGAREGVFAKIEKNGWTGIAFVNTEATAASVTLTAYTDAGTVVATRVLSVGGYEKVVNLAESLFSQDTSSATYIAFTSDKNVVGFQLNGSADWTMLDGLPALTPQQKSGEHEEPEDYIWDSSEVITIELNGNLITVNSPNATVNGSTVSITKAGTYSITGSLSDGQLIVNTKEDEIVRIILNGVTMSNSGSAPIYVKNANKTLIVLATNTNNYVTNPASYIPTGPDADEINAVIFSMSNLTFYGDGSLTVKGNYKDGITSKKGLIIKSGNVIVESVDHGIRGKDYIVVKSGTLKINAGGDGLKSDNTKDAAKGYITIQDGKFDIIAKGDAVSAETNIMITAGKYLISSGGGSNNRDYLVNNTSAKGIKALANLIIEDGSFTLDSADDAIHSNGSLVINGGSFTIASGDDAIHADTVLEVNGGDITITKCYEGIESRSILTINNGNIHIVSSDDGLNVAAGNGGWNDGSVSNKMKAGQDPFPYYLFINGGHIVIDTTFGDGIDVNGPVEISGGDIIINGSTRSDNGALDFLAIFKMTGGFLIGTGTTGMEQKPIGASSTQCSLMVIFNSLQQPGTVVHIQTSEGEHIVTFMPTKTYQSIVFSSSKLQFGKTYNLFLGGSSTGAGIDGLYQDGEYIPGILYTSFTISKIVTIIE